MNIGKNRKKLLLAAALVISVITSVIAVSAYDGSADPIISLSYLQQYKLQQIDPQIQSLRNEISSLQAQINQLAANQSTAPSTPNVTYDPVINTGGFEVVQLEKGQKVMAGESCEIILRSGTATIVVAPTSGGGISDLTEGKDLPGDTAVTLNHLLLVPRADGRGIHITSDVAFIMVRGGYTIEQ